MKKRKNAPLPPLLPISTEKLERVSGGLDDLDANNVKKPYQIQVTR